MYTYMCLALKRLNKSFSFLMLEIDVFVYEYLLINDVIYILCVIGSIAII